MAFDIGAAIAGGNASDYEASTGIDKPEVTSNSLNVLRMLAEEQLAKEKEIADLEAKVKTAKAELAAIAEKKLPEFMQEHDLPEFKFTDRSTGAVMKISLNEVIRVSIPKGKRGAETEDKTPKALAWFRANEHAGIISKEFVVNLGLRDDSVVEMLDKVVHEKLPQIDTRVDESVAPATVTKIITKRLKDGKSVPDDIFTIFRQTVSSIEVS